MAAKSHTEYFTGAAGRLQVVVDAPNDNLQGVALVGHPHPLMGGTLDNKVAQTLAKAYTDAGCVAWRMNFRGVGESDGEHDSGSGETDDMCLLAQIITEQYPGLPLYLGGFSFGAVVQARTAHRLNQGGGIVPRRLMLVGTAVARFDVPSVPADTLLIHGELDDVIPLTGLMDWARPQALPVLVVPGADHFFHRRLGIIREAVAAAVRRTRD